MATQEYLLRTLSFAQAERARVSANSHFICFNRLRSRIEKNYDPEAVIGADVPAQAIADTGLVDRISHDRDSTDQYCAARENG